jgi:hypothetical protein
MSGFAHTPTRFGVALALVAWLGGTAAADNNTQPVSGFIVSTAIDPLNRSLTAAVSPFGLAQGALAFTSLDPSTGAFTATFTLTNSKGTVAGTVSGQFLGQNQYIETITFDPVASKKAYKGITGGAVLFGMVDQTTGIGLDIVLTGSVSFP